MIHFHSLRVAEIRKETDECVSVLFEVPIELRDTFEFRQGQSLTLRKTINGIEYRRNYSICSAPFENELRIAVKKVFNGVFSTFINTDLKTGDHLDVMPPNGRFYTELDPSIKKSYVAFAAGSGITPVISIIKTTLKTEPKSDFTLVYGNKSRNSIIFKEAIEELKDKYLSRFRFYHILSREKTDTDINYGRIDQNKLKLLTDKLIIPERTDEYFLCGPDELIFGIRRFLESKGVAKEKIHFELFTVPGEKHVITKENERVQKDVDPKSIVQIKLDGIVFQFEMGYEGKSILETALAEGADLPYACKGGVCTTCKARLKEGKVRMDVNWSLEPDELQNGYILTCQSHPETEKVFIDFD